MSILDDPLRFQSVLNRLRGRPRRLVEYLAAWPGGALTGEIAQACAFNNVSDAAIAARRFLEPEGFTIDGGLPSPPSRNRFGEVSFQYHWRIVRLG